MRTVGIESRAKGLLVSEYNNKKVLLRVGGAIPTTVGSKLCVVGGFKSVVGGEDNKQISLEDLPQDKIKELMKKLSEIRKKKYERCKETRYGNLCRAFTEEELKNFFKCCKNPRAFLAFIDNSVNQST
jgi:predicted SAM-dependent methyltransferase